MKQSQSQAISQSQDASQGFPAARATFRVFQSPKAIRLASITQSQHAIATYFFVESLQKSRAIIWGAWCGGNRNRNRRQSSDFVALDQPLPSLALSILTPSPDPRSSDMHVMPELPTSRKAPTSMRSDAMPMPDTNQRKRHSKSKKDPSAE